MRNKRKVSAASVVIAIVLSAMVGGALTYSALHKIRSTKLATLANSEEQRADEAIAKARRQANQANRAREQAEELIEFVLDDLRTGLLPIGRTELLSAAGERAAAYFEGLLPDQITTETELKRGKVLITIGQALTDQGDFTGAAKRFREGLAVFESLVARQPNASSNQFELAWSLTEFSIILNKRREFDEADAANQKAVEIFRHLISKNPQNADWVYGLAAAHLGLGTAAAELRKRDQAIEQFDQCVETARQALEIEPGHILSMQALAIALNNTGLVHVQADEFEKAIPIHQQGSEAMRKLMARDPKSRRWEKELATTLNNIGISHDALKNYEKAERYLNEALAVRQGLAAWDSRNTEWLLNLANSWHNIAALKFDLGEETAAHEAAREALRVYLQLVVLEPENKAWLNDMQESHEALVGELVKSDRPQSVRKLYKILIDSWERLLEENPELRPWEDGLVDLHRKFAQSQATLGASAVEILPILKGAASVRSRMFARNPDSKGARHRFGIALARLGLAAREAKSAELELQCFAMGRHLVSTARDGEPSRSDVAAIRDHSLALSVTDMNVIVAAGDEWRYWDLASVPANWKEIDYDDSTWQAGRAPLGYGNGNEATVIAFGDDPREKHITAWFRKSIEPPEQPSADTELHLGIVCDDGAVVYWNGKEIARHGMPSGPITAELVASLTAREPEEHNFNVFNLDRAELEWRTGTNVIAVEVHQNEAVSSDLRFDFELIEGFRQAEPLEGFNEAITARELGNLVPDFLLTEIQEAVRGLRQATP